MQVEASIIAKRYATAFLNLYINELTENDVLTISKLANFLMENRQFYVYLSIPSISYLIKQKALNRVAQELNLNKSLKKLMFVVLDHGRIDILDKILKQIDSCYKIIKNIEMFTVTSSHEITESEKNKILEFIKKETKATVEAKFLIDKNLICGFRIKSYKFLWERSISKQLQDVKKFILDL
ncbi:ATP synthase F1 subunit delta [Candidatus Babeliales bacterium]|nr:ATP synthase F1 subunit delta [Candidatus Babeliales bacterium]MCF7899579.1 ATP synthase F1 subunit delta [Candidatus Babeliales bacterium]